MIFASRNESGVKAWKLVLDGKKTVTRRLKPQPVGVLRAVCPSRGKRQVCKIQILSCVDDTTWQMMFRSYRMRDVRRFLLQEAHREGFKSWGGLQDWFYHKYGEYPQGLYRIEFRRVEE